MNKGIFVKVLLLLLIAIALGSFIKQKVDDKQTVSSSNYEDNLTDDVGIQKGQIAPNFTVETLEGESITLSELKGKKVILNFWATWCPPCKVEMPHFQSYFEKHSKDDNVVILAANMTYKDKNVQQFVNGYDLTFPILLLESDDLIKTYEVLTIPSTFFIDSEGKVQKKIVGAINEEIIQESVKELD